MIRRLEDHETESIIGGYELCMEDPGYLEVNIGKKSYQYRVNAGTCFEYDENTGNVSVKSGGYRPWTSEDAYQEYRAGERNLGYYTPAIKVDR